MEKNDKANLEVYCGEDLKSNLFQDFSNESAKLSFKTDYNKMGSDNLTNLRNKHEIIKTSPILSNPRVLKAHQNGQGILKNSMSINFEKVSDRDKQSPLSSFVGANSNSSQTPPSNARSAMKMEKKVILKESNLFAKSIANAIDMKGKKKKKLIKHCKEDPAQLEEDEEAVSENSCPYRFSTDNEFYLAFHSKFYQDFKISHQSSSFILNNQSEMSIADQKRMVEAYVSNLSSNELKDLWERHMSKLKEIEEKSTVTSNLIFCLVY